MWKTVCRYVHVCVLLWRRSNSTVCVVSDNLAECCFIDIVRHLTGGLQASSVLVVTIPVCSIHPQWHTHVTMLLNWHILHRFPWVTTHTHTHTHMQLAVIHHTDVTSLWWYSVDVHALHCFQDVSLAVWIWWWLCHCWTCVTVRVVLLYQLMYNKWSRKS